ncbi:MAG: type I methionyl aminopeptidase [Bacteroidetes bacterium]|nr:type I methionyl aminopeptidase [Bacteroidota bacterium]MBS1739914.1 type I methionyl aminopeptidase [Bacteroidota bacterium]MBS1777561.1 type I methionyl aminopeptidase [Bacteroidota bacterium]
MIHIRTKAEIEIIRQNALMVTATLTEVAKMLKPGITTQSIDAMAETFIRDHGGIPSFKGYGPKNNAFPASLCISVNEVVVHGFPNNYELKEGDVISVDCGFNKDGYHGDHAYTFAIGEVPSEVSALMRVTKESLARAIAAAKENNRVGDISFAVEYYTHKLHGYGVVRELVGHGVGKQLHEDPQVPNYGRRGDGKRLKQGMVLAIEPMINLGTHKVHTLEDGWTIVTDDGKVSVHYEHTTLVGKHAGENLSQFGPIEEAERNNPNLSKAHLVTLSPVENF